MLYFKPRTNALFKGLEKEGPDLGKETLFIVGQPLLNTLIDHFDGVKRLYFGAGFLSYVNDSYISSVYTTFFDVNKFYPEVILETTLHALNLESLPVLGSCSDSFNISKLIITLESDDVKNYHPKSLYHDLMTLKARPDVDRFYLKYDKHQTVIVVPLASVDISHYADFNNADTIIYQD